jgi:hypothetical protein
MGKNFAEGYRDGYLSAIWTPKPLIVRTGSISYSQGYLQGHCDYIQGHKICQEKKTDLSPDGME